MKQFAHSRHPRLMLAAVALFCISVCAAAEPRIRKASEALDSPLSADIRATSLAEMVDTLARVENINLCIDESALKDAGTSSGSIGPLEISNVTLRSALHALLAPHGLSFIVKDDVIVVTTQDKADSDVSWQIQPVQELLNVDCGRPDYDSLIELISFTVSPQTWSEGTGPGPLTGVCGCLIFEQTPDVVREIAALLDALKRIKNRDRGNLNAIRVEFPVDLKFAERMNELLSESVDLKLENVSLAEFVELLRHKFKLPVRLDQRTLDDAGIRVTESRVSLSLRQVPLRDAIALAFAPFELTTYLEFEQVWLSTEEASQTKTHLEVYPVSDLLAPEDKHVGRGAESLMQPLAKYLLPKTWAEQGGGCSMDYYRPLQCLVVSQTEQGHIEVANFLQTLRKHRSMPPQPVTLPAAPPTSSE